RVLALCETVDSVIEQDDVDVEVAPDRVNQVIAADRKRVPVSGDDPHRQLGVRSFYPGRDCRCSPVDAVKPVGVHVIGEAARAADPRYEHCVLALDTEFWHHLLNLREYRIISAAGTPSDLLIRHEIFSRQLHWRRPAVAAVCWCVWISAHLFLLFL